MSNVLFEDLKTISNDESISWDSVDGKKFLITGGTGLLGSLLVRALLLRNKQYNSNIGIYLVVRDIEKAKKIFDDDSIVYIESSVEDYKATDMELDYIIHAAAPTKSKFMVEKPVETITTQVCGTKNMLDQARRSNVKSMVYLSSMEMYGVIDDANVDETKLGYVDPLNVRSSYPEGKRICELYNYSYFKEYGVPTKIVRLAQTFGPGISPEENRVYKYFVDAILNGDDIVLKSTGSTIINYSYTVDSIIGILCVLLNGKDGEAYNVVGDKTNMTIYDSAQFLIDEYGNGQQKVIVDIPKGTSGFAPDNKMVLSNDKIKSLGFKPKYDLKQGYKRLIDYLRN